MLDLEFTTLGRRWQANLAASIDLAIRLQFPGPQPRFFAADAASATPLRTGSFTGTVASGASCNCSLHSLAPHCHGTHTECIGHLTDNAIAVAGLTPVPPALALLVSVQPEPLGSTEVVPGGVHASDDPVITRAALAAAAGRWSGDPWTALVVRTQPNNPDKRYRQYAGPCPAPYFTTDAMHWIVEHDVASLVVDLPSLDRADDGGALAAHRVYWGLPPGGRDAREAQRGRALVTELAYAPDDVPDGLYLLDLHVPAFDADAAPSRPVLYAIRELAP